MCIAGATGHFNHNDEGGQSELLLSTFQVFHNKVDGAMKDYSASLFQATLPVTTSCQMTHGILLILPSESFRL